MTIEACMNVHRVYEALEDVLAEGDLVLANPLKCRLIAEAQIKTDELDALAASPQAAPVARMTRVIALGTGSRAAGRLREFLVEADADELILAPQGRAAERIRGLELLAEAGALAA